MIARFTWLRRCGFALAVILGTTGAGFSGCEHQTSANTLAAADQTARRRALDLCYRRTIPPGGRSGQIAYENGLRDFAACMRTTGFPVRVVDEPAKKKFSFTFLQK